MSEFTITSIEKGQRLDKFLITKLPDQSRSQTQKRIKAGGILVNNKKPTIHQFLKENDVITVTQTPLSNTRAHPFLPAVCDSRQTGVGAHLFKKAAPGESKLKSLFKKFKKATQPSKRAAEAFMPRLKIIEDTGHYIVINKPAGLLVHEAPGSQEPTLVDIILKKYPKIAKVGEDPLRPGIVHRLDREVSGLLVIAKTQDMFDHLKKQFKSRQIKKEYTALVYGAPQKPEGEISFNIDRSETIDYKMAAVPTHEERGRRAITEFEVTEHMGNYTLLKIKPKTGRTHQIRVHLNAYGLPIVGDLVYKPKKLKTKIKMDRIFLNAHYLSFKDLDDKLKEFTISLPANLENILAKLRIS
jgi:23S rRNA pseudouridine1911/1915/1917 synthase